ncbi:MAG: GNAT family N-acetyltransferase [Eubacteriales bacterium]|nr:GNAT family N-acetyltransferase [Eubacteriales bacterium]
MEFTIEPYDALSVPMDEVLALYESVGWANYTKNPAMLEKALSHSLAALCARTEGRLIGLIRAVGDGHSVLYVQDVLVLPQFQRGGVGKALFLALDCLYPAVYQKVLLTDDLPENAGFYESCGFTHASRLGCAAYVKITR